ALASNSVDWSGCRRLSPSPCLQDSGVSDQSPDRRPRRAGITRSESSTLEPISERGTADAYFLSVSSPYTLRRPSVCHYVRQIVATYPCIHPDPLGSTTLIPFGYHVAPVRSDTISLYTNGLLVVR